MYKQRLSLLYLVCFVLNTMTLYLFLRKVNKTTIVSISAFFNQSQTSNPHAVMASVRPSRVRREDSRDGDGKASVLSRPVQSCHVKNKHRRRELYAQELKEKLKVRHVYSLPRVADGEVKCRC